MVRYMKESGTTARHSAKESFIMWMGISMRDSGSIIRQMDTESTLMPKERGMKAIGKTTSSMAKDLKCGMKDHSMKVNM